MGSGSGLLLRLPEPPQSVDGSHVLGYICFMLDPDRERRFDDPFTLVAQPFVYVASGLAQSIATVWDAVVGVVMMPWAAESDHESDTEAAAASGAGQGDVTSSLAAEEEGKGAATDIGELPTSAPELVAALRGADESHVVHIMTLGVHPGARRLGLGMKLICAAMKHAYEVQGAHVASLNCLVTNDRAMRLYARCGFVQTRRRKDYYSLGGALHDAWELRALLPLATSARHAAAAGDSAAACTATPGPVAAAGDSAAAFTGTRGAGSAATADMPDRVACVSGAVQMVSSGAG